jgi:hypothetical protein
VKIGVVVDGVSEYASLPSLYAELRKTTGNQILRPVKADIHPTATVGVIVRQCSKRIQECYERGADRVVVLIDREDQTECPGEIASAIETQLAQGNLDAHVVIKDRTYENWLLGDIDALKALPGRFSLSKATVKAVQPNKADNVDALSLLKRSVRSGSYHKVDDSKRICEKMEAGRLAQHSRSFRRFLRILGDSAYGTQSAIP